MSEAQTKGDLAFVNHSALQSLPIRLNQSVFDQRSVFASKNNINRRLDSLELDRNIDGLFGITLYNEDVSSISVSLASLAFSIEHLLLTRTTEPLRNITICILSDGLSFLPESIAKLLRSLGLDFDAMEPIKGELSIHQKDVSIEQLKSLSISEPYKKNVVENSWSEVMARAAKETNINSEQSTGIDDNYFLPSVSLMFCVKKENAGKLDSHWWMYRGLCAYLQPKYCFQMDTGTAPKVSAISEIWERFESKESIAGIASSIAPLAPRLHDPVLARWQYTNFSKTIFQDWPTEVASGHLSVIPGQFSGLRWQAVDDQNYAEGEVRPFDVYFNGLGELTPYQTMLYLAEDRVLCSELATANERNWCLDYVASSEVVTDYCTTWPELYKQRKRWCAGYLACRLDLISRIPKYIFDRRQSWRAKVSKTIAATYHSLQLLLDWFIPAFVIVCYGEMAFRASNIASATPHLANGFYVIFGCTIAVMSVETIYCLRGKLDALANRVFMVSRYVQVIFLLLTAGWLAFSGSVFLEMLLIFTLVISIPLSAIALRDSRSWKTFCHCVLIAPMRPSMAFSLWAYAICNTHDNSWGTKGLDRPSYQSNARTSTKRLFLVFRRRVVLAWLFSNVLLTCGLFIFLEAFQISIVLSLLAVLTLLALLPSLLTSASHRS